MPNAQLYKIGRFAKSFLFPLSAPNFQPANTMYQKYSSEARRATKTVPPGRLVLQNIASGLKGEK